MKQKYNPEILEKCLPPYLENDLKNLKEGLKNNFKYYGGKNGGKICIVYQGNDYMLKFPAINEGISEYIVCNILKTLGLNVQETILGRYRINEEEKIVVACKDFTTNGTILKQFAEFKNSQIETSKNGYGTELSELIETRVYIFPTSALKYNDKKINYFSWISGLENEDCNQALLRIFPRIDLEKINAIIDETPCISNIRKAFYKKILKMRYEMILKVSYEMLIQKENNF